jgi:hypothetical protein
MVLTGADLPGVVGAGLPDVHLPGVVGADAARGGDRMFRGGTAPRPRKLVPAVETGTSAASGCRIRGTLDARTTFSGALFRLFGKPLCASDSNDVGIAGSEFRRPWEIGGSGFCCGDCICICARTSLNVHARLTAPISLAVPLPETVRLTRWLPVLLLDVLRA